MFEQLPILHRKVFHLGWPEIDVIMDFFFSFVGEESDLFLLGSEIPTVSVHIRFLTLKQGGSHVAVVDIGCGCLNRVNQPAVRIHTNVFHVAEIPLISFLG